MPIRIMEQGARSTEQQWLSTARECALLLHPPSRLRPTSTPPALCSVLPAPCVVGFGTTSPAVSRSAWSIPESRPAAQSPATGLATCSRPPGTPPRRVQRHPLSRRRRVSHALPRRTQPPAWSPPARPVVGATLRAATSGECTRAATHSITRHLLPPGERASRQQRDFDGASGALTATPGETRIESARPAGELAAFQGLRPRTQLLAPVCIEWRFAKQPLRQRADI